jgi:cysteine desulfurase
MTGASEVYLDHGATAPLDPRVKAAMDAYLASGAGNPHSSENRAGWRAAEALDRARRSVAGLIGAQPECIVFTSGATEADNLAILGLAAALEDQSTPHHALYSAIEHPAVRAPMGVLRARGWRVEEVPVRPDGLVDPSEVERRIGPATRLVSVMAANNEIGTLQPLAEIAAICRSRGAIFHSDAAQCAGKLPLDVGEVGCDLMSRRSCMAAPRNAVCGQAACRWCSPWVLPRPRRSPSGRWSARLAVLRSTATGSYRACGEPIPGWW